MSESRIIGEVLRAAADGPFFPDWEFFVLVGLHREQVRRIADEWPVPILGLEEIQAAVHGAVSGLLYYPHGKHDLWPDWVSVEQKVLEEVLGKLRERRDRK